MPLRAAAFAAAFVLAAPAAAQPPVWVVSDEDSRMVLFPTIHILPPETEWRSDALDAEIAQAEEIWFEAGFRDEGQAELMMVAMRLGFDTENSLERRLPPELHKRAGEAAVALGVPAPAIEPMQPWMLAVTLSVLAITKAGFDPDSGVEKVLEQELDGREPRFLETPAEQLGFFAALDETVQQGFLDHTLSELPEVEAKLGAVVNDWANGSIDGLMQNLIVEMREQTPVVYDVLIVQRNADWVETLGAELDGAGTDFVAVGAAHLVGEHGLPTLFAERGYTVERLTP